MALLQLDKDNDLEKSNRKINKSSCTSVQNNKNNESPNSSTLVCDCCGFNGHKIVDCRGNLKNFKKNSTKDDKKSVPESCLVSKIQKLLPLINVLLFDETCQALIDKEASHVFVNKSVVSNKVKTHDDYIQKN